MEIKPIQSQLKQFVDWKMEPVYRALNMAEIGGKVKEYWSIMPQWSSALFTDQVDYTVVKLEEPNHPLKVKVVTESTAVLNEFCKKMVEDARKEGVPIHLLLRTGAPFQTKVQTKSMDRYANQAAQIEQAQELFRMQEYLEDVHPKHIALLKQSFERSLQNLETLKTNGSLAIVGKLPSVSTGWGSPIKTRGDVVTELPRVADQVKEEVTDFYAQLIEAISLAPADGCDMRVSGLFHGILMGSRDDGEVVSCSDDFTKQTIISGTRKTGVVPSSFLHNKGLDPVSYRRNEVWARYATEYTMLPFVDSTIADIISKRLATMPGSDPEEVVWLSLDIGHQQNSPRYTNRLEIPDPGKTLGADSIMMAGKILKVSFTPEQREFQIAMLESGAEFTMDWYLVLSGIFASWARRKQLTSQDFRFMTVGDDLQVLIKRKYIADFLAKFGPWLKAKGMKEVTWEGKTFYVAFLVGQFVARTLEDPDKLFIWVSPRHIKTTPGPKIKELYEKYMPGQKPILHEGDSVHIETPAEQKESIKDYWTQWRHMVYYFGPVADYVTAITTEGKGWWQGRLLASTLGGGSEWMEDEVDARDMGAVNIKPVTQEEPSPSVTLPNKTIQVEAPQVEVPVAQPNKVEAKLQELEAGGQVVGDGKPKELVPPAAPATAYEPHYHLPPDGKCIITLKESGRTPEQYAEDKKASNPQFQTPGKDHADWPKGVPVPESAKDLVSVGKNRCEKKETAKPAPATSENKETLETEDGAEVTGTP